MSFSLVFIFFYFKLFIMVACSSFLEKVRRLSIVPVLLLDLFTVRD